MRERTEAMEERAGLWHDVRRARRVYGMFRVGPSTLQLFLEFNGASAILVALWMAFVVLHRRRLERAAVILAAICAIATAYLYVSLFGFSM